MNCASARRSLRSSKKQLISTDRRRYGKIVTKVEGIDDSAIDINQLAKLLKNRCAAGGTVKGRVIELQGDHKKKAAVVLRNNGFNVEVR
jgi:translation initiation factor 1